MRKRSKEDVQYAFAHPSAPPAQATTTPSGDPTGEATDGELLGRIARRDRRAFEALYRRYARAVFGLALRRLGDRDRAEEAVQETFAAVWRSARSYRPERGPGGPWLYAVARNAIVDRLRGRTDIVADVPETTAGDAPPEEVAEAGWVAWQVHRALEALPAAEREVLELAYWHGLSQTEVAAALKIPLGTVKTRTRSALGRLSRLLEREDLR